MFIWVSMDPVTNEIIPYDSINSRYLELTYQTSESVSLLIDNIQMIVNIYFNKDGNHIQKTLNDYGERMVRRADSENNVNFNGITYPVNIDWGVEFYYVAWVNLNPVDGKYVFYSKENSLLLESALREKKQTQSLSIILPHTTISAWVKLNDPINDDIYEQYTGPGLREVKRIILKNNNDTNCINIYLTPDDGTIDGNRYRFTSENNKHCATEKIKYNDEFFINENSLPLIVFGKLNDLDLIISQLNFKPDELSKIANHLKNEPYRLTSKRLIECYNKNLDINAIINDITDLWVINNYLTKNKKNGIYYLNDSLFENLDTLFDGTLFKDINIAPRLSNYNIKKAIASVLYLIKNGNA